jgi:hypothetical protein
VVCAPILSPRANGVNRFQRAIHRRHVQAAEMAAREMSGLSLADALLLCELLANTDSSLDRGPRPKDAARVFARVRVREPCIV